MVFSHWTMIRRTQIVKFTVNDEKHREPWTCQVGRSQITRHHRFLFAVAAAVLLLFTPPPATLTTNSAPMLQLPMRCVFDRTPGPCRVSENHDLELGLLLVLIFLAGKSLPEDCLLMPLPSDYYSTPRIR